MPTFNVGPQSAFRWLVDDGPLIVVFGFGSSLSSSTKKEFEYLPPLRQNFLNPRMNILKNFSYLLCGITGRIIPLNEHLVFFYLFIFVKWETMLTLNITCDQKKVYIDYPASFHKPSCKRILYAYMYFWSFLKNGMLSHERFKKNKQSQRIRFSYL